jgi:hypothetical protein
MFFKKILRSCVLLVLSSVSSVAFSETFTFSDALALIDDEGVIVVPDTYTSIGNYAFRYTSVVDVTLPETIQSIGEYAFADTPNLRKINIPTSITNLTNFVFSNSGIEEITIPDSVSTVGQSAFKNTGLKMINLPDGLSIGNYAFLDSALEHVKIGDDTSVGYQAFANLPLISLEIGENTSSNNTNVFERSNSVKTIISASTLGCEQCYNGFTFGSKVLSNLEIVVVKGGEAPQNLAYYYGYNNDADLYVDGNINSNPSSSVEFKSVTVIAPFELDQAIAVAPHGVCSLGDNDNDGYNDCYDQFPNDPDRWFDYGDESNDVPQPPSNDGDGDGILDVFDFSLSTEDCYSDHLDEGAESLDTDQDGLNNRWDCDDDNDGLLDIYETGFAFNYDISVDGLISGFQFGTNPLNPDSDFDGTLDGLDAFPLDNTESLDTDSDGIGNNADTDDDNDGYSDFLDAFPTDSTEWADSDLDGIGNNADLDDDNDGVADAEDAFPHTASESLDSDNDGVGDNADAFPNDATEVADTDLDGIGNNADPDDDNDGVADADDGDPLNADIGIQPSQLILVAGNPVGVNGHSTRISLSYDTSDGNNQLPGIGFRLHYSSEMLSFAGTDNGIANDIIVDGDGPYQDDSDFDNDTSTDKYIIFGWAALNGDWPNSSLPASLVDVVFNVSWEAFDQASITTPINFSKVSTTEGYNFEATNYTLNVLPATWDFDGNGQADALTDGLILLRHAFGVRGASLTDSVMATDSTMTSEEVQVAVEKALVIADVDGDGNVDALTDGLIVLRYMFGLTGDTLMDGVVSANATRASSESVQQHIELYMPNNLLPPVQSEQSFIVGDWKLASQPQNAYEWERLEGTETWGSWFGTGGSEEEAFECVVDDIYKFEQDSSFTYSHGSGTYATEATSYNAMEDGCATTKYPWDGSNEMFFEVNSEENTIKVSGKGAYIVLPEVANGINEIPNAYFAPDEVIYNYTRINDNEIQLMIVGDFWVYRFNMVRVLN